MPFLKQRGRASRVALLLSVALPAGAFAQDDSAQNDEDVIVVTGSYIAGSAEDAPSPVLVVGRDEINEQGAATVWDVVKNLVYNTGSTTNSDPGAENSTIEGTANINLRNLGQNSTLTLINGKRQVVAAAVTQDGSEFVDINAIPSVMVQRLEVLADGGSALYGSDAVAGVVNIIMRDDFDGLELNGDYQYMETSGHPADLTLSAIGGRDIFNGRGHFVLAGEYFQRDQVRFVDTPIYDPATAEFFSSISDIAAVFPGIDVVSNPAYVNNDLIALRQERDPGFTGTLYTDPLCGTLGLGETIERRGGNFTEPNDDCGIDTTQFQLVNPSQDRVSLAAALDFELTDNAEFYSFFQYSDREIVREDRGSVQSLGPSIILPVGSAITGLGSRANGPLDIFNLVPPAIPPNAPNDIANGGIGAPALVDYFTAIPFPGSTDSINTTSTQGAQLGVRGDFSIGDRAFNYDVSYAYSYTELVRTDRTLLRDRSELAINGLGGPNCTPNGVTDFDLNSDLYFGNPGLNETFLFGDYSEGYPRHLRETISLALTSTNHGVDGCEFLNPFLTQLTNPDLANSPELIDWISPLVLSSDRDNELQVFDAIVSGELFDMAGGPAAFAAGYQYRQDDKIGRTYDAVRPGLQTINTYDADGNPDSFRYGSNDNQFGAFFTIPFVHNREVNAAFLELQFPVIDSIETQFAVRYEDYGGNVGAQTSPKAAVRWQALDALAFRGSYSQSFRAPNTGILFTGTGADGNVVVDRLSLQEVRAGILPPTPENGEVVGVFQRNLPSPNVQPETADTYNLGVIFEPVGGPLDGFYASLDYWHFDLTDRVVPQPLFDALEPELALFVAASQDPGNYVEADSLDPEALTPFVSCDPNNLRPGLARVECVVDPRTYRDPAVERTSDSTQTLVNLLFNSVNAGRIISDGVDLNVNYGWDTSWGDFNLSSSWTYVNRYAVKDVPGFEQGFFSTGINDAAGTTGDGQIARSLPDLKGNTTLSWRNGSHAATGIARYISGYDNLAIQATLADATPFTAGLVQPSYDDYVAFDFQYAYTFDWPNQEHGDTTFTVGVLDAFEADVPFRIENGQRYDTTVYDPRGRRFYLRFSQRF